MARLRFILAGAALLAASVLPLSATTTTFTINVPKKGAGMVVPYEISKMRVIVGVNSEAAVTFQITSSRYSPVNALATGFGLLLNATQIFQFSPQPVGSTAQSSVIIVAPHGLLPAGDPARRKFEFIFSLSANIDLSNSCNSTLSAGETFTITVTAGPPIEAVCVQSLDPNTPAQGLCGASVRAIPQSEPVATISGIAAANLQGCRIGLDAVLVLDRSGSMAAAPAGTPKIDELHSAAIEFVNVWSTLRANEIDPMTVSVPIVSPPDKIGVVYFDDQAQWLKQLIPGSITVNGLSSFDDNIKNDLVANLPLVGPRNFTAIGGGLQVAGTALAAAADSNRHVILLMTDGIENTAPFTQVTPPPPNQNQVQTRDAMAVVTNLPSQPPTQIHAVTLGTGGFVDETFNQNVTGAAQGRLTNTTDPTQLQNFFLELLQNFVHYSTVEILRLAGDTVDGDNIAHRHPRPIKPRFR